MSDVSIHALYMVLFLKKDPSTKFFYNEKWLPNSNLFACLLYYKILWEAVRELYDSYMITELIERNLEDKSYYNI